MKSYRWPTSERPGHARRTRHDDVSTRRRDYEIYGMNIPRAECGCSSPAPRFSTSL